MSEGTWLRQQKKHNSVLWIVLVAVAVLVTAGIFLRNNADLLWGRGDGKKEDQGFSVSAEEPGEKAIPVAPAEQEPVPGAPSADIKVRTAASEPEPSKTTVQAAQPPAPTALEKPEKKATAPAEPAVKQKPVSAEPPASNQMTAGKDHAEPGTGTVLLEDIKCVLMDRNKPTLRLSLELYFDDYPEVKREIMLKRDACKVMVKKVLSAKSLDELVVETLRVELKKSLNAILEKGDVTDIVFREFRVDKVE